MIRHMGFAALCIALVACSNDETTPVEVPEPGPVVIDATVNVQLGDTEVGLQPLYIVTTSLRATQDNIEVPVRMDSIILSYRLNDSPFVVGAPLYQRTWSGNLPFIAHEGDHYTLYARMYSTGTGTGGRKATAISDWDVSGKAVLPQ